MALPHHPDATLWSNTHLAGKTAASVRAPNWLNTTRTECTVALAVMLPSHTLSEGMLAASQSGLAWEPCPHSPAAAREPSLHGTKPSFRSSTPDCGSCNGCVCASWPLQLAVKVATAQTTAGSMLAVQQDKCAPELPVPDRWAHQSRESRCPPVDRQSR